jgi:pimeloyl-ACP methyl ester carboxylesterase
MQREFLVMIPGTLCDERIFAQQAKYLRRHCNVILVNYRDLRSIKDWPQHLLAKLPLNFSVLGFSLGGIWALELLRQAPQRIKRIALIASNAEAASKVSQLRSKKMWATWKVNGPKSVIDEASKKYFHHDSHLVKHLPLLEDMALKTKSHVAKMTFEWAAKRPCGHAAISKYENPILLVSGQKDMMCPKETQKKILQNNTFAKWIELPRCGHFIPLEHPKKLNQFIQNWLNTPTSEENL